MVNFCLSYPLFPGVLRKACVSTKIIFNPEFQKKNNFLNRYSYGKKLSSLLIKNLEGSDSIIWELDFFSRPVLNEEGKKIWELIIVDQNRTFEHVETIPNNLVNSKELRKRINILIEKSIQKPKLIKFFRTQMFNMINIALSDLDVIVRPSRRTFNLFEKIANRESSVYPKLKGYRPFMRDLNVNEVIKKIPQKMPDTLRGDKYIFASISNDELTSIANSNIIYGDLCPLPEDYDFNQNIPGIVIFSKRAKSLSSWLDGVELFNIMCDLESRNIIIECGLDLDYLFATFPEESKQDSLAIEPKFFEKNKKKSKGIHFIAVQQYSDQKKIYGLWTLRS